VRYGVFRSAFPEALLEPYLQALGYKRLQGSDLRTRRNLDVAQAIQIRCINKSDRYNPHERIRSVGGTNADGTRWKLSEADAITGIEQGRYSFYVERPVGDRVGVIIARSAQGNKYLKTQADGEHPNNLLSLPECP
jgi:uncharacterized protein DUF3892